MIIPVLYLPPHYINKIWEDEDYVITYTYVHRASNCNQHVFTAGNRTKSSLG